MGQLLDNLTPKEKEILKELGDPLTSGLRVIAGDDAEFREAVASLVAKGVLRLRYTLSARGRKLASKIRGQSWGRKW